MTPAAQAQLTFCGPLTGTSAHRIFRAPPEGQRLYIDYYATAVPGSTHSTVIFQEGKVDNNHPVLAAAAPGYSGSAGNVRVGLPLAVGQELYARLLVDTTVWVTVIAHYGR